MNYRHGKVRTLHCYQYNGAKTSVKQTNNTGNYTNLSICKASTNTLSISVNLSCLSSLPNLPILLGSPNWLAQTANHGQKNYWKDHA